MAFMVAHVTKFKSGNLTGMGIHVDRKTENHSNECIDVSKSIENVQLVSNYDDNLYKAVEDRIKQGYTSKRKIRKDAVKSVGVVCSASREIFEGKTKEENIEYFKQMKQYFEEKIGKDNIVSASIHFDETTPHMHLFFVPITEDGRLCAKEITDRIFLRNIHRELPKRLQEKGYNIEKCLIEETKEHISKKDYNIMKALEELEMREKKLSQNQDLFNDLEEFKEKIKKNKKLFGKKYDISDEELNYIISLALPNSKTIEKSELLEKENNKLKKENKELNKKFLMAEAETEDYKNELFKKNEELEKTKNEVEDFKRQLGDSRKMVSRYKNVIDQSEEATKILKNNIQRVRERGGKIR